MGKRDRVLKFLRKWVMDGHNPRENPGSRYLCLSSATEYDFLDVYRMDREIRFDIKGMSKSEQEAYLKEYMGWTDDSADDAPWIPTESDSPFGE